MNNPIYTTNLHYNHVEIVRHKLRMHCFFSDPYVIALGASLNRSEHDIVKGVVLLVIKVIFFLFIFKSTTFRLYIITARGLRNLTQKYPD